MKLIVIILCASLMQVSAASFAQKITLKQKEAPLTSVLQEIRKQTGFDFIYDAKHLVGASKVNLDVTNTELKDVLTLVFSGQKLDFLIKDKFIVLTPKKESNLLDRVVGAFQTINVSGRVLDENRKPMQGVNVRVKGTVISVVTDSVGRFYLRSIDEKSVLQISFLGYKSIELIAKQSMEDINMEIVSSELLEVTVSTGYQNIRKEQFVGSYSQLDSAAYARRTGMKILDRLDGTVTGVLQDKKGGTTNAKSLQIRGISTIEGINNVDVTTPLIILDNFPFAGDINAINQNDVESITVLKDAAAAATWGAKAGNGVIVITTKKGGFNRALSITLSSNVNVTDRPDLYYNPKMSSSDYIGAEKFLFDKGYFDGKINNSDFPNNFPAISPVVELLARARANPSLKAQTDASIAAMSQHDLREDLNRYAYRRGVTQQHYLNIRGGSSIFNYSFSAGYNHGLNNVRNSKADDQYTLNSNNSYRPLKNLEISVGLSFSQGINKSTFLPLPPIKYPYMQLADPQGNALAVPNQIRQAYIDTVAKGKILDWNYRPLDEVLNADNTIKNRLLILNLGLNYKITPWLDADFKYQRSSTLGTTRNYYNMQSFYTRDLINQYTNLSQTNTDLRNPVPLGGIIDLSNSSDDYSQGRAQFNFNKAWGTMHHLTAYIAGDVSSAENSINGSRLYGYDDLYGNSKTTINYLSNFPMLNAPTSTQRIPLGSGAGISENNISRIISLSSNLSYSYHNRYTFYASARRDGTNLFGAITNNRWKPLWSVGASWEIAKEPFFKVHWVDNLRLKGTIGYLGNTSPNASALATIAYRGSDLRTNQVYASVRTPSNPELRWEQVKLMNLGTEFSVLKNRLSGSFEVFQKISTDIMSEIPVDPSVGLLTVALNSASLKGNGFELNLRSQNTNGAVSWKSNFGISYTKTVITKLYAGGYRASDYINYGLNAGVGLPAYSISAYKWAGLDPLTGDPLGILNGQVSKDYAAIFTDSVQHQLIMGSAIPLYSGFFGNTLTWKNLTVSANISYRLKFYYRKPTINYSSLANGQGHADYNNRWKQPGDESNTNIPSFNYPLDGNRDNFYAGSEVNVLRGDNVRLQDVRLQYNLVRNRPLFGALKTLQLFMYVNNLNIILWKKDRSGLDPDYSGGNDPAAYPASRVYAFGLNANF